MSYKLKYVSYEDESTANTERKLKAEKDFVYFCNAYLPHIFKKSFADFQLEIVRFLEDEKQRRIVVAAPRQHGKTSLIYLGYVLWSVLFKKHKYIVCLSASEQRAEEALEDIRVELQNNEHILDDFEDLIEKATTQRIVLKNGVTVVSRGAGQKLRGLVKRGERPDLVILDDIESEEHAHSHTLRQKLKRWFYRVVMGLSKDAKVFVIGTILHYDSLLNELIEKGQELGWFAKKYKAVKEDGTPLHPYLWTVEELEKKRQEIGSYAFASEYLNNPLTEEDAIFKESWFKYYDYMPKLVDIAVGVDPATGKNKDFTAVVVAGKDREGNLYTLYIYNKHASPSELIEELIRINKTFKPRVIVFEDIAFQEVYKKFILEKASAQGEHLPIRGIKPKASKEVRASKLAPLIENGLLLFKKGHKELLKQLREFPMSAHDDLVDALVYAIEGLEQKEAFKFFRWGWL